MKNRKTEIDTIINCLACAIRDNSAVYASTPLTNGLKLIAAARDNPMILQYDKTQYDLFLSQEIIPENCKLAESFVRDIQDRCKDIVIDPSKFFSEGWSQDDYLYLWGKVIIKFTNTVWLNAGWQYSNGCTYECMIALQNKKQVLDHNGRPIDSKQAAKEIRLAIKILKSVGIDIKNTTNNLLEIESI